MILRTISGYCLEWQYRYSEGTDINRLNSKRQFEFLPGCFDKHLASGPDVALTMDLNSGIVFARTGDGTLRIQSDDTGLLVTADLVDSSLNRRLCHWIDIGRIRGWSHKAQPLFGGFRITKDADSQLTSHHQCQLQELTLVVNKFPRARSRTTPIFLTGGPKKRGRIHA